MNSIICTTNCEMETYALGKGLAASLFPGAFVALYGELGAGKTVFARGVGEGLHISDVASPTFNILQEHEGDLPLYHFDAYRLNGGQDLINIGFTEYLSGRGVILLEWPEFVIDVIPDSRLDIRFCGSGEDTRTILFTALDERYSALLTSMQKERGSYADTGI